MLHVSDLHLNPAAWDVIDSVVEQFDVAVVVDTGDITDFGSTAEDRYVREIGELDVPYVYVRGNHDSTGTQRAVAAQPNAVVLDGPEVVEVAGVRLLGQGDPRFTPDKSTRDDDAPVDVLSASAARWPARWAPRSSRRTSSRSTTRSTAGPLEGRTPVVLAGHTHRREVSERDGTLLMVQGSTGGAGLRALETEEPTPVSLTVLYLSAETGALQAYDDITLGGLGTSDARISREVVAEPLAQAAVPTPTPSARPSPSP